MACLDVYALLTDVWLGEMEANVAKTNKQTNKRRCPHLNLRSGFNYKMLTISQLKRVSAQNVKPLFAKAQSAVNL